MKKKTKKMKKKMTILEEKKAKNKKMEKNVGKVKVKFSTNSILKSFKKTLQQSIVFCEEIYNYNYQPAQY